MSDPTPQTAISAVLRSFRLWVMANTEFVIVDGHPVAVVRYGKLDHYLALNQFLYDEDYQYDPDLLPKEAFSNITLEMTNDLFEEYQKNKTKLSFEQWYELNVEKIIIELAESGADREMDFDSEKEFDKRYEKYIAKDEGQKDN